MIGHRAEKPKRARTDDSKREDHQAPVARGDGVGDRVDLFDGHGQPLWRVVGTGP
jgi:hypothetical protein